MFTGTKALVYGFDDGMEATWLLTLWEDAEILLTLRLMLLCGCEGWKQWLKGSKC